MIGIINIGMGNIASVRNALDHLDIPHQMVTHTSQLHGCDKIILPGVGAFGLAMRKLIDAEFVDALREFALIRKKPLLGICLGMQLLLDSSTEHGFHQGLALIRGTVESLHERVPDLPIPHVGWNTVATHSASILLSGLAPDSSFYFVHSYYCSITERSFVAGTTSYGIEFDAVIEAGNIFGVQFHPEKSQTNGLSILKRFGSL